MEEWKPSPSRGYLVPLAAAAAIVAFDAVVVNLVIHRPVDVTSFLLGLWLAVSLPLLAVALYWAYASLRLRYRLDRNALTIVWGASRQVVPLARLERVVTTDDLEGKWRRGLRWPGQLIGVVEMDGVGPAQVFATQAAPAVVLVTRASAYAITPADPRRFLADLEVRRRLGAIRPVEERNVPVRLFRLAVWRDHLAWALLGLGLLSNAVLFGYVTLRYPGLPTLVPLHVDALGQPDRIGFRTEIFRIPAIGLLILAADTALAVGLHRRERLVAYLLLGAGGLTQAFLLLALFRLIR